MKNRISIFIVIISFFQFASAQNQLVLKSQYLLKPDTVWIFTPENYNSSKIYPMIYLLHGWSGNYHQWDDIMNCQNYANTYEFIIVCPDGLYDSWYINSPAIVKSQYVDFFYNDLAPEIINDFAIDTSNIFITGLSMGGHGALYLFVQNSNLFKSAGSISGVVDLSFSASNYEIKSYLGLKGDEKDNIILEKYSIIGNINKIAKSKKEIIFSCGTEDPFYNINNELRKKCDELKIKATYITSPGAHNYDYWNKAIAYQFLFFNKLISNKD